MRTVPLSEAKDKLSALVEEADKTHEIIQITRHGHPSAVLMSAADLESLISGTSLIALIQLLDVIAQRAITPPGLECAWSRHGRIVVAAIEQMTCGIPDVSYCDAGFSCELTLDCEVPLVYRVIGVVAVRSKPC